ncbi:hypothetical protein THMIRHAS_20390 [Thiosulfatimonas sediminis]|uniref:Membrane protein FxsA n=1 Tax=Thiosulfatimonas sediminis TaxID=2675054 RepID=A0A6F8PX45_9GAMM|nr:FxsA family protein [Thiosulfatimonas sediminis]BBP46666.1 hypothetical protein THMIRHAS_20390 [Thiosulfatimonas sediminis]
MKIFLLFFLLIPLLELYLLIELGSVIGALPTVLWVIGTAVVGVYLIRRQGMATMLQAQQELQEGKPPQQAVINGVLIFIGGVLLFIPGLITDTLGGLLLLAPLRHSLVAQGLKGMQMRGRSAYRRSEESVIEGEWTEKPEAPPERLQQVDAKRRD